MKMIEKLNKMIEELEAAQSTYKKALRLGMLDSTHGTYRG